MDEARYELPRKAGVKTFTNTDFEGRYYDEGQVEIFLDSKQVDYVVLNRGLPCQIEVSLRLGE